VSHLVISDEGVLQRAGPTRQRPERGEVRRGWAGVGPLLGRKRMCGAGCNGDRVVELRGLRQTSRAGLRREQEKGGMEKKGFADFKRRSSI
jgi:hypothetical protein